jgi:ribonuclease HI
MTEKYTINCDANKPTKDSFVAAYIVKLVNKIIHKASQPVDSETSCEGEYDALLLALHWCEENNYDHCRFLCDSKFVVCGVNNVKSHSKPSLSQRQKQVKQYLSNRPNWVVEWIPREDNSAVDSLTRMNPTGSVETFKQ